MDLSFHIQKQFIIWSRGLKRCFNTWPLFYVDGQWVMIVCAWVWVLLVLHTEIPVMLWLRPALCLCRRPIFEKVYFLNMENRSVEFDSASTCGEVSNQITNLHKLQRCQSSGMEVGSLAILKDYFKKLFLFNLQTMKFDHWIDGKLLPVIPYWKLWKHAAPCCKWI